MRSDEADFLALPREVLSVSELNRKARGVLESSFPVIWVEGEISNLARPASGHYYFSLKDAAAQVRCALFRPRAALLDFTPANGMQVVARARVSLYEGRGEFQLLVEHMQETGSGALQRAFEALKKRLFAEGLFDTARKRPLPALPRCIGVITSPTGAAVRDILSILRRRFAAIPVIVYPVPVQGSAAPPAIAQALATANQRRECDVLVLARGGGSLEDLWAFNDEALARAIFASEIPVVSAVGHEIDFTIADFVADARAPTPSAAAELLSPDGRAWLLHVQRLEERLLRQMRHLLRERQQRLDWLVGRLQRPRRRVQDAALRLEALRQRLLRAARLAWQQQNLRLRRLETRLQARNPQQRLKALQMRREYLEKRLLSAMRQRLAGRRTHFEKLERTLEAVSPLRTLQRGYAIVSEAESGRVLLNALEVPAGTKVRARLARGTLYCQVEDTDATTD